MDKGYDSHTYEKVGQWFEEHREEMAEDIKRLVRIPSISDPQAETSPAACLFCSLDTRKPRNRARSIFRLFLKLSKWRFALVA